MSEPPTSTDRNAQNADAISAILLFLAGTGCFFVAGPLLARGLGAIAGTALGQLVFFLALPAAGMVLVGRRPAGMNVALPPGRSVGPLVLAVPLIILFFLQYQSFQETYLFESRDTLEKLYHSIFETDRYSAAALLAAVALVPALSEEYLFRGVLQGGLRTSFGAPAAVAVSAVLFTAVHGPLVVMPSILLLGVLLGTLAAITRSVLPGMVLHFLNNAIVVLSLKWPDRVASVLEACPAHPAIMAVSGLAVAACLVWLHKTASGRPAAREGAERAPADRAAGHGGESP